MKFGNTSICLVSLMLYLIIPFGEIEALVTVNITTALYSINIGDTVTLKCVINQSSVLNLLTSVYWERNIAGNILKITSTTNINKYTGGTTKTPSLTIFNVNDNDAGLYTCFASDIPSTGKSPTITLNVLGKATAETPMQSTQEKSALTTTELALEHSNTAQDPAERIVTSIQSSSGEVLITLTQSLQREDTVTISKSLQEEATVTTTPSYNNPPINSQLIVTARQSENITLFCNVDDAFNYNFLSWTKTISGVKFQISENMEGGTVDAKDLVLHDIKWTDAGLYACYARNELSYINGTSIYLQVDTGTQMCSCSVDYFKKLLYLESQDMSNYTREELRILLHPILQEIRQKLQINPRSVSSYQRRLKSAENRQHSAIRIGYVGAVFLATVFGLVVISDLAWIQQHIDTMRRLCQ